MGQFNKPATQAPEQSAVPARLRQRARLLPTLMLAALIGCGFLLLVFWLSGGFPALSFSSSAAPTFTLSPQGPYTIGSSITFEGQQFSSYAIVVLLLDGQPAPDNDGQPLTADTAQNGTFSLTLTIPADWGTGNHVITALDTARQLRVSVTISIEGS